MQRIRNVAKHVLFLLIAATGITVMACDNEEEMPGELVPEAEVATEISDFFNKEYPNFSDTYPPSFFLHEERSVMCIVNDKEQFLSIYHGDGALPEIDFAHYSLIIGKERLLMAIGEKYPVSLKNKELYKTADGYSLNLYCDYVIPEVTMNSINYVYYWGIYPKMQNKSILVKINM